jgi:hypothetical protein
VYRRSISSNARAGFTVGKECIENFSACPGVSNLPNACDLTDNAGNFGGSLQYVWKNDDVWERDFKDQTLNGQDHVWADNVDVFLFSGHGTSNGSNNYLGLIIPGPGCNYAESGSVQDMLFNRTAQLVFLDASCSATFAERHAVWYGGGSDGGLMITTKQGFGFMNSPNDRAWRYMKHLRADLKTAPAETR